MTDMLYLLYITGPFVGWLLDRFSIRQVTLCGALVAACGFISSTFAPNVEILILTYGVIGGKWINLIIFSCPSYKYPRVFA